MILQKVISVSDLANTCLGWAVTFIQRTNKCDCVCCCVHSAHLRLLPHRGQQVIPVWSRFRVGAATRV